jgi:KUP system potassium uptake protein
MLGVIGAALFYGDGIITPAISVLSAIEGLKDAPGVGGPLRALHRADLGGILVALFLVQSRGHRRVGHPLRPDHPVWFLILGALGLIHLVDDLTILRASIPGTASCCLLENGFLGFVILGSVFLAVTGAEALYADMGHFGKAPIRPAGCGWPALPDAQLSGPGRDGARPSRGAAQSVLGHGAAGAYWPVLLLATAATVIASQAVITGAFSVTQQAVQLGLLPSIDIKRTSETQAGQIFVPAVNTLLMVGVLILLVMFQSSHEPGLGLRHRRDRTMLSTPCCSMWCCRHWEVAALGLTALLLIPLALDLVFLPPTC